MRQILTAAGALGSTGLIIVPAFNRQQSLPAKEARAKLVELLQDLGTHASDVGTRILLEPLNRRECYFLRQLADAAAICRDVNSPGVAMMGDFWHMTWEETSDLALSSRPAIIFITSIWQVARHGASRRWIRATTMSSA